MNFNIPIIAIAVGLLGVVVRLFPVEILSLKFRIYASHALLCVAFSLVSFALWSANYHEIAILVEILTVGISIFYSFIKKPQETNHDKDKQPKIRSEEFDLFLENQIQFFKALNNVPNRDYEILQTWKLAVIEAFKTAMGEKGEKAFWDLCSKNEMELEIVGLESVFRRYIQDFRQLKKMGSYNFIDTYELGDLKKYFWKIDKFLNFPDTTSSSKNVGIGKSSSSDTKTVPSEPVMPTRIAISKLEPGSSPLEIKSALEKRLRVWASRNGIDSNKSYTGIVYDLKNQKVIPDNIAPSFLNILQWSKNAEGGVTPAKMDMLNQIQNIVIDYLNGHQ